MGRPRKYDDRVTTAIRLPRDIHERLHELALERDVSVNYLLTRAATTLVDELSGKPVLVSSGH
jgi:predicted DNA-binding protein